MQTWTNTDKKEWNEGPWLTEPDKAQWIDEKTGLDCLIHRGPHGALCGYVGVPKSHEYFEVDYEKVDVDVHGGLTFSDKCSPSETPEHGICHTGDIANETVWWLGFDCAHSEDSTPKSGIPFEHDAYKDFDYVKNEVTSLASQL